MKKFQITATDTMGAEITLFESDSKKSAQNKARSLKKDGAYSNVTLTETAPETAPEPEAPKAKSPKSTKKADKVEAPEATDRPAPKCQVPDYDTGMDLLQAVADRESTVTDEYVMFVRSTAPKTLGIKATEFHKIFGAGHVNQGDVVLLSTVWDDDTEAEFLAHCRKTKSPAGARKQIDFYLAQYGLFSTRRGSRTPGQKWGSYNPKADA